MLGFCSPFLHSAFPSLALFHKVKVFNIIGVNSLVLVSALRVRSNGAFIIMNMVFFLRRLFLFLFLDNPILF